MYLYSFRKIDTVRKGITMENLQETIQNKVSFYRDDMITYWKDLVNYQAGSKEAELITDLLQ